MNIRIGFFKVAETEGTRQLGTFHSILMRDGLEYQTVIILKHFSSLPSDFPTLPLWNESSESHKRIPIAPSHVCKILTLGLSSVFIFQKSIVFLLLSNYHLFHLSEHNKCSHCAELWTLFSHLQLLYFMIVITLVTFTEWSFSHIQAKSLWKAYNTF